MGGRQFTAWASMSASVYFPEPRAGKNHRMRKMVGSNRFAQMRDRGRVAQEVAEAHVARIAEFAGVSGVSPVWTALRNVQRIFDCPVNALPLFWVLKRSQMGAIDLHQLSQGRQRGRSWPNV